LNVNETTRNNACWALGEIVLVLGSNDSKGFIEQIVERLVPILNAKKKSKGLTENSAALMGRMAYVCPDLVAAHLDKFAQGWFTSMKQLRHEEEREQAYKGLCLIVRKNPKACAPQFQYLCDAISSYESPPKDIAQNFYEILQGFKQSVGNNWNNYFDKFPDELKNTLTQRYRL
jgi:transportin-1